MVNEGESENSGVAENSLKSGQLEGDDKINARYTNAKKLFEARRVANDPAIADLDSKLGHEADFDEWLEFGRAREQQAAENIKVKQNDRMEAMRAAGNQEVLQADKALGHEATFEEFYEWKRQQDKDLSNFVQDFEASRKQETTSEQEAPEADEENSAPPLPRPKQGTIARFMGALKRFFRFW